MKKHIIFVPLALLLVGGTVLAVSGGDKPAETQKTTTQPAEEKEPVKTPENTPEEATQPAETTPTLKSTPTVPKPQQSVQPAAKQCPAGTYRIGGSDSEPVCKNEPTGCPYGDSIPVDSPKCAPSER